MYSAVTRTARAVILPAALIILACLLAFACDGGEGDGGSNGGNDGDSMTIDVTMGDNFFEPKEISVAAGEKVTFDLGNDGALPHNMRIAGLDGKFNTGDDTVSSPDIVLGRQNAMLEWQATAQPGSIPFQCDIHPGVMAGTITVR